jgi:hypothetical protein
MPLPCRPRRTARRPRSTTSDTATPAPACSTDISSSRGVRPVSGTHWLDQSVRGRGLKPLVKPVAWFWNPTGIAEQRQHVQELHDAARPAVREHGDGIGLVVQRPQPTDIRPNGAMLMRSRATSVSPAYCGCTCSSDSGRSSRGCDRSWGTKSRYALLKRRDHRPGSPTGTRRARFCTSQRWCTRRCSIRSSWPWRAAHGNDVNRCPAGISGTTGPTGTYLRLSTCTPGGARVPR